MVSTRQQSTIHHSDGASTSGAHTSGAHSSGAHSTGAHSSGAHSSGHAESSKSGTGGGRLHLTTRSSMAVANYNARAVEPANIIQRLSDKNIMDLPPEIIQKIGRHTGYKTVGLMRMVCKKMNNVCGSLLNATFTKMQNDTMMRFQTIKSQMPRRESLRRNHPLACECDIIETVHMRLTLLQMSLGKHIERKHCCFFPAEILDEVNRILHYVQETPRLARPYKVTDELYDLTSMAMEYFKEHIEPGLPEITYFNSEFLLSANSGDRPKAGGSSPSFEDYGSSSPEPQQLLPPPPHTNMVLRKRIRKIKQGMKRYGSEITLMKREFRGYKTKIADQQRALVETSTRLDECEKKNEELSREFSSMLQEMNKCKTELQYWRSKSPMFQNWMNFSHPGYAGLPNADMPAQDMPMIEGMEMAAIIKVDGGAEKEPPAQNVTAATAEAGTSTDEKKMETSGASGSGTVKTRKAASDSGNVEGGKDSSSDGEETSGGGKSRGGGAKRKNTTPAEPVAEQKKLRGTIMLRSKCAKSS